MRRVLLPLLGLALLGAVSCGGSDHTASVHLSGNGATTDISNADPLLTIKAAHPGDLGTATVSMAVGDFNGDGKPDLLMGIPFFNGPNHARAAAGEAVVIFGGSGLTGEIDLSNDEPGLTVLGARPGDNLGFSVAAGDVNGDGIDDIIIGAPGSNTLENIRTNLGEVYVINGRRDLGGTIDTAKRQQDFTLVAAEGFARLGTSIAVGDVNGDGIADIVAGAPFGGRVPGTPPGGPRTETGEVYVMFGRHGLKGNASVAKDQQDLLLAGQRPQDQFGQSVAVGDVNGDGIADIVVGAPGYDGPPGGKESIGGVFAFFGSHDLKGKVPLTGASFAFFGAHAGDTLGQSVALGDFNGDHVLDIAAGMPAAGRGDHPDSTGGAAVVFGSRGLSGTRDLASKPADASVTAGEPGGLAGTTIAAGDLDGDGRADLVLGAPLTTPGGRQHAGVAYVISGKRLKGAQDLQASAADSVTLQGELGGDAFGSGVAIVDLYRDGHRELLGAATAGQGSATSPGRVYAVSLR